MKCTEKYFENLFIEILERMTQLKYKSEEKQDNLISRFLDYAINIAQSGLDDKIIDMELQYEITRICMRKDIDDEVVKCLFIVKSLSSSIVNKEYNKILLFAQQYVDAKTYDYLNHKLANTFVGKD